jgi:protein-S-isoprenylcysteine O-methyltransferase Ste14
MIYLRLYLLLGMIIHKLVWEIYKKKQGYLKTTKPKFAFNLKTMVKVGKTLFLLFLVIQTLFLSILPISNNPIPLQVIGVFIYTSGLILAIIGRVQLGKNWANIEDYQILHEQQLVKVGIYKYIRHPIYAGDFLLLLGLELALNSWLVLIVIPLAFVIYWQAKAEEKLLRNEITGYSEYQQSSWMFIPNIL